MLSGRLQVYSSFFATFHSQTLICLKNVLNFEEQKNVEGSINLIKLSLTRMIEKVACTLAQ